MKFKYLKLSLLMVAISAAPFAMRAATAADVDGAAQLLLELTDVTGPQRSLEQTIATVDQFIAKLKDEPEYKDVCDALRELKEILVRFNIAQAKGILGKVTGQLEGMYSTLSEGMKNQLNQRKEQLAKLNPLGQLNLLKKLGVSPFGKK